MYINLSAVCEDLDQELCSGLEKSDCLQFPSANTTCIQTCEICKCQDTDISTCKIADTKRCKLWPEMKKLCPVSCGICKPGFLFGIIFLIYFWRIKFFYILYPFLFVMAVLIFLGTDTTTTQAIPTKLTTLSPASTTRAAGTDTYYWKSFCFWISFAKLVIWHFVQQIQQPLD